MSKKSKKSQASVAESSAAANIDLDRVIAGDCVQVMQQLASDSVDMVFADPPYNLQLSSDLRRPNNSTVKGVTESWDQFGSLVYQLHKSMLHIGTRASPYNISSLVCYYLSIAINTLTITLHLTLL